MSTVIRNEISKKNKYWIPKERYLELKHFCLQYPTWVKDVASISYYISNPTFEKVKVSTGWISGTEYIAERLVDISGKIEMINDSISEMGDPAIAEYVFQAVTLGKSFTQLKTTQDIPCGKDYFYERYRKFFWILDQKRESNTVLYGN